MKNINLDTADYKTILAHKGKVVGVIDSCKIDEFMNSLDKFVKDAMSKAKGVLINFAIHKEPFLYLMI